MKVVIVEDEIAASENLTHLLLNVNPEIQIQKVIESVEDAVTYFTSHSDADLIMMDIHLADGISFEIFDKVSITTPIIFTTAYDQYAIQAFKVNSIDYLLKPIVEEELAASLEKFKKSANNTGVDESQLSGLLSLLSTNSTNYKSSLLVQKRDELVPLKTDDIAYIYIDTGMVKAITYEREQFILNKKLEDLETELDPKKFLRVNRQFIVAKEAITKLKFYFNGKLIVHVDPPFSERIVVSKAKAGEVKSWLNE